MRKIIITENDIVKIVNKIIIESKTGVLSGREYKINDDGTLSIKNSKKEYIKIRFSALSTNINLVDITKENDEYVIKTKNGKKTNITQSQVKEIIYFVDSVVKTKEMETGMLTPKITLKKI
jgi:hypothetical protein